VNCNNFSNLSPREAVINRFRYQIYTVGDTIEWKIIPGFPEYKISNYSIVRHEKSFGGKARNLVQTIRNNKYFYVTLTGETGKRVGFPVDLLMVMTFYDIDKNKIQSVIHLDNIKHNNQLANLNFTLK
jgi:hypothetical protein